VAVAVAGCGEKPEPSGTAPKARQSQAAGGGDEQPIRQRVAITVGKQAMKPARAQVDAFLGIRLVVRNVSGRAQIVEVRGAKPTQGIQVAKGVTARLDLEGLRPGSYRIQAKPTKAHATLVAKRSAP
jgi:hypothetical protein